MELKGLRISWATPAARVPRAARRSCLATSALQPGHLAPPEKRDRAGEGQGQAQPSGHGQGQHILAHGRR
jgi:hypothetical protein